MPRPKKQLTKLITPEIKVAGQPHVFETLEEEGTLPVMKSVGMIKVSENSRDFISYTLTTHGDKVLKIEVSEPNLKAIAGDAAKSAFVQEFMNDDGVL